MTLSPKKEGSFLKLSEVRAYARKFNLLNLEGRRKLIVKIWLSDRKEGLDLLADMLGVTSEYLYKLGNIDGIRKGRNRTRRKRRKHIALRIPHDAGEVAMEAAGGVVHNTGGKKTTWKSGNGTLKSAASGQAWQALTGI